MKMYQREMSEMKAKLIVYGCCQLVRVIHSPACFVSWRRFPPEPPTASVHVASGTRLCFRDGRSGDSAKLLRIISSLSKMNEVCPNHKTFFLPDLFSFFSWFLKI